MKYSNILKAEFISRPNRFVAYVNLNGNTVKTHVKNTGRCKELLVEGVTVYIEDFSENMRNRKLAYSLIGVEKRLDNGDILMINMDSQAPNKVVREALENGSLQLPGLGKISYIKPESIYGSSRLDFYVRDENGAEGYIEVKGVTLEHNGVASFPDAPTERGIKHLHELSLIAGRGINAYVLFVIQMNGMKYFEPDRERHAEFADALTAAQSESVIVLAHECSVTPDSLTLTDRIEIRI